MDHPKDNKHLMLKRGSSKALRAARGLLDSSYHDANDDNEQNKDDDDDDDDDSYVIHCSVSHLHYFISIVVI